MEITEEAKAMECLFRKFIFEETRGFVVAGIFLNKISVEEAKNIFPKMKKEAKKIKEECNKKI